MSAGASLIGLDLFNRQIDKVVGKPKRRALRRAFGSGASVVRKSIRAEAPREDGTLQRSLGTKIGTVKVTKEVYAVIGPRSKFFEIRNGKKKKPALYARLIEFGTIKTRKNAFMRRGYEKSRRQAFRKIASEFVRLYEAALRK